MRTGIRCRSAVRRSAISNTETMNTTTADTNSTAAGPHLPQRDWSAADYRARSHTARLQPEDGTWLTDTDAVDHLIGRWDAKPDRRVDGCEFQAVAELAWRAGVPAEDAMWS